MVYLQNSWLNKDAVTGEISSDQYYCTYDLMIAGALVVVVVWDKSNPIRPEIASIVLFFVAKWGQVETSEAKWGQVGQILPTYRS